MIEFLFLLAGILLIVGISRYNENEKLFWKLFISFVGAFAAAVAVSAYISNDKKDKIEYLNTTPTQALDDGPCDVCTLADPFVIVTYEEQSSDPVSKEYLCSYTKSVLSEIAGEIRGQPFVPFDTS